MLKLTAIYPPELPSINLDTDWFYRKPFPAAVVGLYRTGVQIRGSAVRSTLAQLDRAVSWAKKQCGPLGPLGRSWSTGGMVIWAAILLGAYLVIYYL